MAIKMLYREPIFAQRQQFLIDMCASFKGQDKNFLYISPSYEIINDVRLQLYKRAGKIGDSNVITFADFKQNIAYGFTVPENLLDPAISKIILDNLCVDLCKELVYFKTIAKKDSFKDDIYRFIEVCKCQGISPNDLSNIIEETLDPIFKDKLRDIQFIYSTYERELRNRDAFDLNDISSKAISNVVDSTYLDNIDVLIIDGFIDLKQQNIELIKEIADNKDIDIYINIPYVNRLMKEYSDRRFIEPLISMGFDLEDDGEDLNRKLSNISTLASKLYRGEKIDINTENISIKRYRCIRDEIWGVGEDIKKRLELGDRANNIAVFIADLKEHRRDIFKTFRHLNIPIAIDHNVPIGSSIILRELIDHLKGLSVEQMEFLKWIDTIQKFLLFREETLIPNIGGVDASSILDAKSYETLSTQFKYLKSNIKDGYIKNRVIEKEDFLNDLTRLVMTSDVSIEDGDRQGVKVLDIDFARGQQYDHVYILGMNDGIIPNLPGDIDMLTRQEKKVLMQRGIEYQNRVRQLEQEKIRFSLMVFAANKSLTLSYREVDKEDEPLIPSFFVEDIKLISGLRDETVPIEKRFEEGLKKSEDFKFDKEIYDHRRSRKYFNHYEGIIDPSLLNLDDNFHLGATDIDRFYRCPYSFFMDKLMGCSLLEQSPTQYDNIDAGIFYHGILKEYYINLTQFESLDTDVLEAAYKKLTSTKVRELDLPPEEQKTMIEEFFRPLYDTVEIFISKDLRRLKKYKTDTDNILKPIVLEDSFRDTNIFGIDIACRVDRVDMEYEDTGKGLIPTGKFVIYDYKKSRSNGLDYILTNNACQLGIYYYLVVKSLEERGYKNLDCMALLYYGIEENGEDDGKAIKYDGIYREEYKRELGLGRKHFAMDKEVFNAFLGYIKDLTLMAIDNIRDGNFPYVPDCPLHTQTFTFFSCEYENICRYNKDKIMTILKEGGNILYGEPFKGV